jgi:hypothetical protein
MRWNSVYVFRDANDVFEVLQYTKYVFIENWDLYIILGYAEKLFYKEDFEEELLGIE